MKKENKALARQKKAQAKQMLALKKKVLTVIGILLAVVLVVGTLAAIKISSDEAKAPQTLKFSKHLTKDGKIRGINIKKYVELCDLEEVLKLKKSEVEPGEEAVQALMEGFLLPYSELVTEKGIVLEDGDEIKLRYVGTIDGVAFEGGSTGEEGTTLVLGSGSYIEGFEDQLIGQKVGDKVDVKVTFPEDYANAELSGKDAVFAVEIDGVYQVEITDELVAEKVSGCSTVEEFRQQAYDTIYNDNLNTMAWEAVAKNTTVNAYPTKYTKNLASLILYFYEQEFMSINENYYKTYGQYAWNNMVEFYEQYYGMNAEQLTQAIEYNASSDAAFTLICQAISEERNITYTEADKLEFISELGYKEDELEKAVAEYGEGYLCQGATGIAVERYVESLVVLTE